MPSKAQDEGGAVTVLSVDGDVETVQVDDALHQRHAYAMAALGGGVAAIKEREQMLPWLIATLLCYCTLTQGIKSWYIHRFGKWL